VNIAAASFSCALERTAATLAPSPSVRRAAGGRTAISGRAGKSRLGDRGREEDPRCGREHDPRLAAQVEHGRQRRPERQRCRLDDARDDTGGRQLGRRPDEQRHERAPRRVGHCGRRHRGRGKHEQRGVRRVGPRQDCGRDGENGSHEIDGEEQPLAPEPMGGGRDERRQRDGREHLRSDEERDALRPRRAVREHAECDGDDGVSCVGAGPRDLDSPEAGVAEDVGEPRQPARRRCRAGRGGTAGARCREDPPHRRKRTTATVAKSAPKVSLR
jgi:hypothetical protein